MEHNTVKNAQIIYTHLGVPFSDHGLLSFAIGLQHEEGNQAFGMLCLDTVNPLYTAGDRTVPIRIATTWGSSLLLGINDLFEVDWENLKGLPCRAYGGRSKIIAIGHYLRDKWLWATMEGFSVTRFDDIAKLP